MIKMPSSFTIIFSLIIFVTILTYVIPAGKFDKEFKQISDGSKREIVVAGTYQLVDRSPRGFLHPIITILTAMSKGMEHACSRSYYFCFNCWRRLWSYYENRSNRCGNLLFNQEVGS